MSSNLAKSHVMNAYHRETIMSSCIIMITYVQPAPVLSGSECMSSFNYTCGSKASVVHVEHVQLIFAKAANSVSVVNCPG